MNSKFFLTLLTVLAAVATLAWSKGSVLAEIACDPDFVAEAGSVFTVSPTGVDDTANLQCAFDLAVASGSGAEVHLLAGTFHTGQVVINDFQGAFTGEGMDNTIIENIPNLYVTPVDMYFNPPSANNPWPSLFSFVNGNFSVSDLAILVKGDNPTTGWTIFGIEPPIKELALGIAILGTQANARADRVLIEGEPMEDSLFGYNLINGIFFEGFIGEIPPAIEGSFQVCNSVFRRMASGTPVENVSNATITISRNTYDGVFLGMDGGDFANSSYEFSKNRVDALYGLDLYNMYMLKDSGSTYIIKNNLFRGANGPFFEQAFGTGNQCLFLGNNVRNVTDIGIYLGPDISGCIVIGGSNKTDVLNLGTDNILVGVNNMGTGVGPTIQTLMKSGK
jgi:hypothetical protein